MTAAIFQATYSDWRVIKGRKVVSISFEVPLEQADLAYQVIGGMPDPSRSAWFAIASLTQEAGSSSGKTSDFDSDNGGSTPPPAAKERRRFDELPLSQQAALACNDPVFRAYLREDRCWPALNSDEAANSIRGELGIASRSALDHDKIAAHEWTALYEDYLSWKAAEMIRA